MGHAHKTTKQKIAAIVAYLKEHDPKGEGVHIDTLSYALLEVMSLGRAADPARAAVNLSNLARSRPRLFRFKRRGVVALRAIERHAAPAPTRPPLEAAPVQTRPPLEATPPVVQFPKPPRRPLVSIIAHGIRTVADDLEAGFTVDAIAADLRAFAALLVDGALDAQAVARYTARTEGPAR